MKILVGVLTLFLIVGCSKSPETPETPFAVDLFLKGPHILQKMKPHTATSSTMSAGFFLFRATADQDEYVTFAWKQYDGVYIFSKMPLTKTRVVFDNSITEPYITWDYAPATNCDSWKSFACMKVGDNRGINANYLIEHFAYAVIIHTPESEWSVDVKLPMQD